MAQTLVCVSGLNVAVSPPTCESGFIGVDTGLGFDIAQLDPVSIISAFSAGFSLMFAAYAVAWAASFVIKFLR